MHNHVWWIWDFFMNRTVFITFFCFAVPPSSSGRHKWIPLWLYPHIWDEMCKANWIHMAFLLCIVTQFCILLKCDNSRWLAVLVWSRKTKRESSGTWERNRTCSCISFSELRLTKDHVGMDLLIVKVPLESHFVLFEMRGNHFPLHYSSKMATDLLIQERRQQEVRKG